MLNRQELLNYRLLRGVSQKDVADNCDISKSLVCFLENGDKNITPYNHKEYCKGVNKAYQLKKEKMKYEPVKVVKPKEPKPEPLQKVVRNKRTTTKKNIVSEDK